MPTSYDSDDLTNLEAGWKTTLWNGRLQFNGAIYQEKWENVQSSIFAPQLGFPNLTATVNGPEYEVNGIEMSVVVAPMDGLTIQAAGSYNKGELQNSPQFISNNPGSPTFGDPITESCLIFSGGTCTLVVPVVDVFGKPGTELANSPELQWNIRARYEWGMGDYVPFVSAAIQHQDESFSTAAEVSRETMPSWTTMDASVGVSKDDWMAELYVVNLTDENKSLFTSNSQFIQVRSRCVPGPSGYASGIASAASNRRQATGRQGNLPARFLWRTNSFMIS